MASQRPQLFKRFPGFTPKRRAGAPNGEIVGAQFFIGDRGHVIRGRDIGGAIEFDRLVIPYVSKSKTGKLGKTLNVRLGGGGQTRSVVAALADVFATVARPVESGQRVWVPIIAPDTPLDPETGFTRCAVTDVYWVPYSESCLWSRNDTPPKTMIAIV